MTAESGHVVADVQERAALGVAEDAARARRGGAKAPCVEGHRGRRTRAEARRDAAAAARARTSSEPSATCARPVWRAVQERLPARRGQHACDGSISGLVHSSAAASLVELILTRLKQEDLVVDGREPELPLRNWPPALPEWSTKSVRDAFFASPKFPRLAEGRRGQGHDLPWSRCRSVRRRARQPDGQYEPFVYKRSLGSTDIEISEDVFLITREHAEEYVKARESGALMPATPACTCIRPGTRRRRRRRRQQDRRPSLRVAAQRRCPHPVPWRDSGGAANCRLKSG